MKRIFSLLLLGAFLTVAAAPTQARDVKPGKVRAGKKSFRHTSESSQGKNSKAQFRKEAKPGVVDLRPHDQENFKTAKANPHFKYKNPH